jgi:hypothetical protein
MKWTLLTHCWDAAVHAPWSVNETPAKHSKLKASENLSIVFQLTRISVKLISPFFIFMHFFDILNHLGEKSNSWLKTHFMCRNRATRKENVLLNSQNVRGRITLNSGICGVDFVSIGSEGASNICHRNFR